MAPISFELASATLNTIELTAALARQGSGNSYVVYSDGSCDGHETPRKCRGGWAVGVFADGGQRWEARGDIAETTSTRAELCGLLAALLAVPDGCRLNLHTDSRYVVDRVSLGTHSQTDEDLWQNVRELVLAKSISLSATWVPGHKGWAHNERVDQLAGQRGGGHKRGKRRSGRRSPRAERTPAERAAQLV